MGLLSTHIIFSMVIEPQSTHIVGACSSSSALQGKVTGCCSLYYNYYGVLL